MPFAIHVGPKYACSFGFIFLSLVLLSGYFCVFLIFAYLYFVWRLYTHFSQVQDGGMFFYQHIDGAHPLVLTGKTVA